MSTMDQQWPQRSARGRQTRSTRSQEYYACPACGRRFNRRDSLKRHREIHDSRRQQQKSRRRACESCVRCKTRCDEAFPTCSRCEQKKLPCTYYAGARAEGGRLPEPLRRPRLVSVGDDDDSQQGAFRPVGLADPDAVYTPPDVGGDEPPLPPPLSPSQQQAQPMATWPDAAVTQFIGVGDFYPSWLQPYAAVEDGLAGSSSVYNSSVFGLSALFPTPGRPDPMQSPLDFAVSQDVLAAAAFLAGDASPNDGRLLSMSAGTFADVVSIPAIEAAPPPFRPPAPPHDDDDDDDDDEALAAGHAQPSAPVAAKPREEPADRLPALELDPSVADDDADYVCQYALPAVDQPTHKRLCDCLRLPLLRSPWQPMSLAAFPSRQQIDCFVDLYFGHFDWLLPMIHRPTFDPGADLVLTLSMCAIGVFYSHYANARVFGKSLCELLRRLLLCMSEQNVAVSRSFAYLAAQTLHCVLGNSSGSQRLFEFGDNNRGVVVANARCVRLFDHYEQPPASASQTLQGRWEAWICAERARRLAWGIFIFDTSATYYRNCRPHLSLSEMKVQLPCPADLWEADSATAWAALRPWTNGKASANASLGETMRRLFDSRSAAGGRATTALDKVPDEFHRIIASTTLLRMIWDQREAMRGPLVTPTPSLETASGPSSQPASAHHPKTDVVLALLRELTTDALRPAAAAVRTPQASAAFRELVLRARVSLVAQIVAADQISHHLDTSWLRRGDGARRLPHEVAAHTLRAWADADAVQPRRMARIGAQLLAISRLYSFNMPREPYDVFRAGLLLWTMVPLVQPAQSFALPSRARQQRRVCHLDWLGPEDAPEAQLVRDWIDKGNPDGDILLRIQGVPDISSEKGTRQILQLTSDVLRKLHVWGASKTYRDILLLALQGEE